VPELPELMAISSKLDEVLNGHIISEAKVLNHLVVYKRTPDSFEQMVMEKTIESVRSEGKFLVIGLSDSLEIIIHPLLTGRFRLDRGVGPPTDKDAIVLELGDKRLSYWTVVRGSRRGNIRSVKTRTKMGKVYIAENGDYSQIPDFGIESPSALDPDLTYELFGELLSSRRGEIKNVLKNQHFIKGIGNAYADEILLYAGILPFRKANTLTAEEVQKLYSAMRKILTRILEILMDRSINEIGMEKRSDYLMIHNKGGGICPLCGGRISEVKDGRFKTNYCQTCQT
jgi:formamidopyrimidine-DNA glycosylase